jgi:hypothetical protein
MIIFIIGIIFLIIGSWGLNKTPFDESRPFKPCEPYGTLVFLGFWITILGIMLLKGCV